MIILDCPCRWCKYRHYACHSHCFLYKEWKAQDALLKQKEKDWKESNGILMRQLHGLNPPDKKYRKR